MAYNTSFTDGDLSSGGVLSVNHNLSSKYCHVIVSNNSNELIVPDEVTLTDTNNLNIDLSSYESLTGTWNLTIVGGTATSFTDGDLGSGGVLTVNHATGARYHLVTVVNNSDIIILPDEIEFTDTNNINIDLSSYESLTGTWNVIVDTVNSTSFTDADLSSGGILEVNHVLNDQFPIINITNNSYEEIIPDDITYTDANNLAVDLSSYEPLTGTWNVNFLGATYYTTSFDSDDLVSGLVLEVSHNLGEQYNHVIITNNSDNIVRPDLVTYTDSNNLSVDLSSYTIVSGETWNVAVLKGEEVTTFDSSDVVELAEALVIQLEMEDNLATKDVIDSAGNYNGTSVNNTSTMSTTGKIDLGLDFNGSSDYVDFGTTAFNSALVGDFSVVGWINCGSQGSNEYVWGKRDSGGTNVGVFCNIGTADGKMYFQMDLGGSSIYCNSSTVITDSTWRFFCAIRENDDIKIFINTIEEDSTSGATGDVSNVGNLYIGTRESVSTYFDGTLDEINFYNKALSQTEIDYLYSGGSGTQDIINFLDVAHTTGCQYPITTIVNNDDEKIIPDGIEFDGVNSLEVDLSSFTIASGEEWRVIVTATEEVSFTNSDLASGELNVDHSGAHKFNFTQITDNNNELIIPDNTEFVDNDSFKTELTSRGTLSGTWYISSNATSMSIVSSVESFIDGDTITLSDDITVRAGKVIGDTVTLSDDINIYATLEQLEKSDTITLSDSILLNAQINKLLDDTITISDEIELLNQLNLYDTLTLSDSISMLEATVARTDVTNFLPYVMGNLEDLDNKFPYVRNEKYDVLNDFRMLASWQ